MNKYFVVYLSETPWGKVPAILLDYDHDLEEYAGIRLFDSYRDAVMAISEKQDGSFFRVYEWDSSKDTY